MSAIEDALRRHRDGGGAAARAGLVLLDRADREGLADVAYGEIDSPLGPLLVAVTRRGLVRIAYPRGGGDDVLDELARSLSPRVLELPRRVDPVRRQMDEYFGGRRRSFDLPVDWALTEGFTRRVLRQTARVPFGQVTTYRDVARMVGNPLAYRAAGNALGGNPIPIVVPCHRVLRTGGTLGGYTGGLDRKQFLLDLEGTRPPR